MTTERSNAMLQRIKRLALVPAAVLTIVLACPGWAGATPGKSGQWMPLSGTCGGTPAVILDPPGPGPTGFSTLTGKMGVGRLFQWIYVPTGEIVQQDEYGTALEHANQQVVTCEFPIPPALSPDGTTDWLFRVTGFFR
jgi:hypothetical protein